MMSDLRKALLPLLRAEGIARVTCTYSGSNDEGWLEKPHLYNAANQRLAAGPDTPALFALCEQIETFLNEILEDQHPGWEINDGADGEFSWDIPADKLTNTHHEHYMSTNTSEDDL